LRSDDPQQMQRSVFAYGDALEDIPMRFLGGFLTALFIVAVAAVVVGATYNVAASATDTPLEFNILHRVMRNAVEIRAGDDIQRTWTEGETAKGFREYDEMCVFCHAAPGKERSSVSKGMRPQPPLLANAAKDWTNSQLFWIVRNGVRMTGMPAFGVTHSDEQIWNIVGFVRRLPQMSADEYRAMETKYKEAEQDEEGQMRH
jgi:mono/diheme cytochrome c family protein